MRKRHQWHLDVRVHRAGADAREMFQTAKTTGGLKPAHVNCRIAQDFARRSAERSRVETVGELAAFLSNDRHHGSKVYVKAEHAQDFTCYPSQRAHTGEITVLANCAGRGHRGKNLAQTIDQPNLLIDAAQWRYRQHGPRAIEQGAHLLGDSMLRPKRIMPPGLISSISSRASPSSCVP